MISGWVLGCWWLAGVLCQGVRSVWGCLRGVVGGRWLTGLAVAYVVGCVVWAWVGFPGGLVAAVVLGSGYVVLLAGGWVERRCTRRKVSRWVQAQKVNEAVMAEVGDLDGRWRALRLDEGWVRAGRREP